MNTKQGISIALLFFLALGQAFSITICRCKRTNGTSLITYGYAVGDSEGCCTGAVDGFWGGQQNNYELGNEGVYELTSSSSIAASAAQNACCLPG